MISRLISELKKSQEEIATGAMKHPTPDPFEHGVQVGKYQGILIALDTLDFLLRDEQEKESSS